MIDQSALTAHLRTDPDGRGFQELIEQGRANALADSMNTGREGWSDAIRLFGEPVTMEQCAPAINAYYAEICPENGGANGPIEE